jgi:hypothetical protein
MPSRSALNPVSFIRPGTGSILMPNDGTEPDPSIEKPPLSRDWHGGFLETDLSRHGVYVRMGPTRQKRRRPRPRLRGKKRVPKVAMSRAADRANPKKHRRARPKWRTLHLTLNLLRRWFRWFTTNAHRAQPAALRHKRALKALLGKAAETTTDFMLRNRRRRAATICRTI